MNDKPEAPSFSPDLEAAVRRARLENAERAEAAADLREIEIGRLGLLESALKPVVGGIPPGVDMFDVALTQGERPRLFIDMVAFVEMGHDRRTYRFFQDTLHGRTLIAESGRMERIVAAVTDYVARRLVEREKALATGRTVVQEPRSAARSIGLPQRPGLEPQAAAAPGGGGAAVPERIARSGARRARRILADALSFVLMTLGSLTLIGLIGVALYLAWTVRLRDIWAHWLGAPPF